jgi:SAM-dependent methyltransferase
MPEEFRAKQSESAAQKNAEFFADNQWYKNTQNRLELYRLMACSAAHETEQSRRLLDIGNGGIFIYPIDHMQSVEAVDIFVEASFRERYPHVRWRQLSILELDYENEFDTVVVINCLHHVVGKTVRDCYANLSSSLTGTYRALQPGGKLVLLESTVPSWFLRPYKIIFPLLVRVWPLKHPLTFQFHFREIRDAAHSVGFHEVEFSWIPKISNLMTLGFEVPGWVSPVHVGKFVFRKPREKSGTLQAGA